MLQFLLLLITLMSCTHQINGQNHNDEEPTSVPLGPFEAPKITTKPQSVQVVDKGIVSFFCEATGNPRPTVTWWKDWKQITGQHNRFKTLNTANGSVLRIEPVDAITDSNNQITCRVTNKYGYEQATVSIYVYTTANGIPSGYPRITRNPDLNHVTIRSSVINTCAAESELGDTYPVTINWLKDKVPLNLSEYKWIDNEGKLFIDGVEQKDQGLYECVAENDIGVAYSDATMMYVTEKGVQPTFTTKPAGNAPKITTMPRSVKVVQNGIVSFFCEASGTPKPHFTWEEKDGTPLAGHRHQYQVFDTHTGSVLRIDPVKANQHKNVQIACKATNKYGHEAALASVYVYKTTNDIPSGYPRITEHPRLKAVESGHSVTMPCAATAENTNESNPLTIYWLKDRVPLNVSDERITVLKDGELSIDKSREDDEGQYECVADNDVGVAYSYHANLYVKVRRVPPVFTIEPKKVVEIEANSNINVTCIAVGSPMPIVKWVNADQKQGVHTKPQIGMAILMLKDIENSDNFTCVAESQIGVISANTQVIIREELLMYKGKSQPPNGVYTPTIGTITENTNTKHQTTIGTITENTKTKHQTTVSKENTDDTTPSKAPKMTTKPQSVKVQDRGIVSFFCEASGSPDPKVTWMKDGTSIKEKHRRYTILKTPHGSVLRIEPVKIKRDNNNKITCIATNIYGYEQITVSIFIYAKVNGIPTGYPKITVNPDLNVATIGSSVINTCAAESKAADDYPLMIYWLKDKVPLNVLDERLSTVSTRVWVDKDRKLYIDGVRQEDQGIYECVAENEVGVAYSNAVMLNVTEQGVEPPFTKKLDTVSVDSHLDGTNEEINAMKNQLALLSLEMQLKTEQLKVEISLLKQENRVLNERIAIHEQKTKMTTRNAQTALNHAKRIECSSMDNDLKIWEILSSPCGGTPVVPKGGMCGMVGIERYAKKMDTQRKYRDKHCQNTK